jgi:hypothetical protein
MGGCPGCSGVLPAGVEIRGSFANGFSHGRMVSKERAGAFKIGSTWRVTSRALHAFLPSRIVRRIDSMLRSLSLKLVVIAVALPVISEYPATCDGGSLSVMASAAAQRVSAQTSTVLDPVGDAKFNAPEFQDMVLAQMTKTAGGDFALRMELAGLVPVAPSLPPPGLNEIWWFWGFDLDPTTSPAGYPTAPGTTIVPEFIVYVSWDGTAFAGTAIDRRPLLTGGEAIVTPVPFSINGTTVEAVLAFTLIGDVPPSFGWHARTMNWSGPVGSGGYSFADGADTVFGP